MGTSSTDGQTLASRTQSRCFNENKVRNWALSIDGYGPIVKAALKVVTSIPANNLFTGCPTEAEKTDLISVRKFLTD